MSIESAPIGEVSPAELSAGDHSTRKALPAPVSHGAGVSITLDDDVAVYNALRDLWRQRDLSPGDEVVLADDFDVDYLDDDLALLWTSSKWKAGMDRGHGWKQWYKHHLKLRHVVRDPETGEIKTYRKNPVSLRLTIEPQITGLTYKDGNEVHLPFGEGTRVNIQTTYCERGTQVVTRALEALDAALGGRVNIDASDIKQESARIWKAEAHFRFDINRKQAVVRSLQHTGKLIDVGGRSELDEYRRRQQEGWLEARVESDRFDHLGFDEVGYSELLKVYQTGNWSNRSPSDPLHHPKLEAAINGTKGSNAPHLSEWDDVMFRLRSLVCAHAEWAGIEETDLVADDYFDPSRQPTFEWDHPEGRREDLANYYNRFEAVIQQEALQKQTLAVYDLLMVIAEHHGATYDQLEELVGLSRSTLQYHVSRLKSVGLLTTIGNPCIVAFDAEYLYETADEVLNELATAHFSEETLSRRRLAREERASEREAKREGRDTPDEEGDEKAEYGPEERGGDDDGPAPFVYLRDWYGTPQMLMDEIVGGDRTERDVRVRLLEGRSNTPR
ncbi:helix-turn-helix domain-containing protein [Halogeometricum sp. CBA1124]|uniref:MarR family transcriptional regulator n=1 Tax=Halogeometricum sp. CBA1124 TaxID=2668071 RepID=UPI001429BA1F|nr:helix-turn-helix domain-containing protein [Halogeometricum sp. CBA1124]MUV56618.1 transcriptional regulator [Halogeometricum sp. CBA1124]